MKTIKITALLIAGLILSACLNIEGDNRTGAERHVDAGTDSKHLSQLVARVWLIQTVATIGSLMKVSKNICQGA